MAEPITVTSEGLAKLQEELEYLKSTKRKEVVEAIRVALSFGDLSENSEYDEAKTEQGRVESRIIELEEMLKNIKVVNDSDIKTDRVSVGNIVKVHDIEFDEKLEYILVGSTEADPFQIRFPTSRLSVKQFSAKRSVKRFLLKLPVATHT